MAWNALLKYTIHDTSHNNRLTQPYDTGTIQQLAQMNSQFTYRCYRDHLQWLIPLQLHGLQWKTVDRYASAWKVVHDRDVWMHDLLNCQIFGLTVTLTFYLLTSKSNQFISIPNAPQLKNLVKFPQAVCKILCSQTFSIWSCTDACMYSVKAEYLRWLTAGWGKTKNTPVPAKVVTNQLSALHRHLFLSTKTTKNTPVYLKTGKHCQVTMIFNKNKCAVAHNTKGVVRQKKQQVVSQIAIINSIWKMRLLIFQNRPSKGIVTLTVTRDQYCPVSYTHLTLPTIYSV